jgi:WAS/WASL-interacting protein
MKEMYKQRQRELALERAQMTVDSEENKTDENTTPGTITTPRLEDSTLPPPKTNEPPPRTEAPKSEPPPQTAPPPAQTRPRETEPAKKKGKRGDDGPPG